MVWSSSRSTSSKCIMKLRGWDWFPISTSGSKIGWLKFIALLLSMVSWEWKTLQPVDISKFQTSTYQFKFWLLTVQFGFCYVLDFVDSAVSDLFGAMSDFVRWPDRKHLWCSPRWVLRERPVSPKEEGHMLYTSLDDI